MSTQPAPPVPHDLQHYPGITIRDYFAAHALQVIQSSGCYGWSSVAEEAFRIADAMCKARDAAVTAD